MSGADAPDDPAQQRETPPVRRRRGNLDHDDDLRGGTRGSTIARLAGRVNAARARRRQGAGARHGRRRR
jgi:hypothetical protein